MMKLTRIPVSRFSLLFSSCSNKLRLKLQLLLDLLRLLRSLSMLSNL